MHATRPVRRAVYQNTTNSSLLSTSSQSQFKMAGDKIPYPKHVWSPAGGWYSQPKNWKANTAVMGLAVFTVAGVFFSLSADREHRYKMPEQGRFFPSRYWSRQIREHERTLAPKDE
ncbi:hypothetical protein D6D28_02729 [Aureobasidium pullulans]|uniref:Uncharacterized protein n=2 Tax=Aureobasidium pullulans TaxID=5580 RepID=A0A4S8STJ0_AURPU|nr:hypothetical protein D6D28_02729 [Aureobasidium pullulans]